ncbi:MAG: hypothetical protein V9G19_13635 [Tetrasphaera sp.]
MTDYRIRTLELVVGVGEIPWASPGEFPVVDFLLDGRDLRDWLDPIERAERGETGGYLGHRASSDIRGLLEGTWSGDGAGTEDYGGRVALLGCTCGDIGCGPLCVRIEREPGWVLWRDIVRFRGPFFDYGDITFRFAQSTYAAAIDRFEAASHGQ